jgi:hypothetical protein
MPRLTYRELGDRLGISADGARFLARRRGWQATKGNDGRVRVLVDDADLIGRSPPIARPIDPPIIPGHDRAALLERLVAADVERERLTADLVRATDRAGKAEGQVLALRDALADLAGRLDEATAELADARRSWLERLIAALRR